MKPHFLILIGSTFLISSLCQAGPILNTTDFLDATNRDYFNSFESIPLDVTNRFYNDGFGPYVEDNIAVKQINPFTSRDIWVSATPLDGNYSWYPNGGDNGHTQITAEDGSDFESLELLYRSYFGGFVFYELFNDGMSVLKGSFASANGISGIMGFTGGVFDTVLVRSGFSGSDFFQNQFQALQIDAIEATRFVSNVSPSPAMSASEPSSLGLIGFAMAGLLAVRRQAKSN